MVHVLARLEGSRPQQGVVTNLPKTASKVASFGDVLTATY
jgi:hypothetical protein